MSQPIVVQLALFSILILYYAIKYKAIFVMGCDVPGCTAIPRLRV